MVMRPLRFVIFVLVCFLGSLVPWTIVAAAAAALCSTGISILIQVSDSVLNEFDQGVAKLFKLLKKNPTFDEHLTPYLHILMTHAKEQFKIHRNLQKFSQQAPEHWMGRLQKAYMNHTNRHDTKSVTQGLNDGGMEAIRRLFVMARVRLLLLIDAPRSLPERSPRSDKGRSR